MSKKHIEALIGTQFSLLTAKDNKARLLYIIAGIKDGKFYNHAHGAIFGVFDESAPDTEFITEKDLTLSRITGTKISAITANMQNFFKEYYGLEGADEDEATPTPKSEPKTEPKDVTDEEGEDPKDVALSEAVVEKLVKEFKKCLKNEEFKKATKILAKLDGQDVQKKLAKKLKKAQK